MKGKIIFKICSIFYCISVLLNTLTPLTVLAMEEEVKNKENEIENSENVSAREEITEQQEKQEEIQDESKEDEEIQTLGINPMSTTKTAYVNANGNDDDAEYDKSDKPFRTINAALNEIGDDGIIVLQTDILDSNHIPIKTGHITIKSDSSTKRTIKFGQVDIAFGVETYSSTDSLTLENVILDGEEGTQTCGLVLATDSSNVTLGNGAVIQNNNANCAAVISQSNSTVTMESGSVIKNNTVTGEGGAVKVEKATFEMTGGQITGNTAGSAGAGIFADGSNAKVKLSGGTIDNNELTGEEWQTGAGVKVSGGATLNISGNATISNNTVTGAGGAINVTDATLEMTGGKIIENTATSGGAIFASGSNATVTLSGGTIDNNELTGEWQTGAGVKVESGATLNISGNAIISNSNAQNLGGGVYLYNGKLNMQGGIIKSCSAAEGGAIFAENNSTVSIGGNSVIGGDDALDGNKALNGHGGAIKVVSSTFDMGGTAKISNNTAEKLGGAIALEKTNFTMTGGTISNNTAASGGAIFSDAGNTVTISGTSVFDSNKVSSEWATGGAIRIIGGSLSVSGSTTFKNNVSSYRGGAIFAAEGCKVELNKAQITSNKAKKGGGIDVEKSTLNIVDSNISSNTSENPDAPKDIEVYGGGIYAIENSKVTISGTTTMTENKSTRGGAICVFDSQLDISGATNISNNTATANAGAIFIAYSNNPSNKGATATITSGTITGNENTAEGVNLSDDYLSDREFSAGAIYVSEHCTLKLKNVVIKDNDLSQDMFIGSRTSDEGVFAGAIGLCPTSTARFYVTDGGAIYDNTGADILFIPKTGKIDYKEGTKLYVGSRALGGGEYNWTGLSELGGKATPGMQEIDENTKLSFVENLSRSDKTAADGLKQLEISGNTTNAIYGGGAIMCNGNLIIGTPGDLSVTKTVAPKDGEEIDSTKEFNFTVTLDDETITGKYGAMDFENGVAHFTLHHGETKTATDLPSGIHYTVKEEKTSGYNASYDGKEEGNIEEDSINTTVTNTKLDPGNLIVKKTVEGLESDNLTEFNFTVTLDDKTIDGDYGEMHFTNGVATFKLKDGETKTAKNLPANVGYTVEETSTKQFQATVDKQTGEIESGKDSTVTFTNTRIVGDLAIKKTVTNGTKSDKTKEFNFTITLTDTTIDGEYGDMNFSNGVAHFTLHDNETKTVRDLPVGTGYNITEENDANYKVTKNGDIGRISGTTENFVSFTNERNKGNLEVTKTVKGLESDKTKDFNFTVTLTDEDNNPVSGEFDGVTFDETGKTTFALKDGQKKTITGLPAGVNYKVEEEIKDLFVTTFDSNDGNIKPNDTVTSNFTNTKTTGDLVVEKIVKRGIDFDKEKDFKFTVTLTDENDNPVSGEFNGVTFDENGKTTFTLKHGDTKTITGLPVGSKYVVSEEYVNGYDVSFKGTTGTISKNTEKHATITNWKVLGSLLIKKTVAGVDGELDRDFNFTVTLTDENNNPVSGKFGTDTFDENGKTTFTLKHGKVKYLDKLPAGVNYKVEETEANSDYYQTTVTGDTGIIEGRKSITVEFVNFRELFGDLSVTKKVTGRDADLNKEFNFIVTLDDPMINGEYGEMTFAGGVAHFTLHNDETITANNLPAGVGYKVVEEDSVGYSATYNNSEGVIKNDTEISVLIENVRDTGELEVSKTVQGTDSDKTKEFNFTVTLDDATINGEYGDMTFTDGVAHFTLKHNETKKAVGLPTGVNYTVEEVDANKDGFSTLYIGEKGTIEKDKVSKAEFINSKSIITQIVNNIPKITPPNTMDNIINYFILLIASALGFTLSAIYLNKRKNI